jgi:uncharacterized delta-60 repeat protein
MRKTTLFLTLMCTGTAINVCAADGDVDPSFGTAGIAKINAVPLLDQEPEEISKSVRGFGDRNYIVGTYIPNEGTKEQAYIARLLPDGTLDSEFAGGMTTIHFGEGSSFSPRDAVLTPEGGLLLAGPSTALDMGLRPTLCKLTPAGELDNAYGMPETPGCRVLNMISAQDDDGNPVMAIAKAANGNHIVALSVMSGEKSFIALTRLTPEGLVDETFGENGFASFTDTVSLEAHQVAVRPDGRIVATGTILFSPTDRDIVLIQIDEDGVGNSAFTSQSVDLGNGPIIDTPSALALRANGEIVIAGSATVGEFGLAAVILRFDETLTPILPDDSQFPGTDVDEFRRAFVLCDSCIRKQVTDIAVLGDDSLLMVGDYNFGADDEAFALRLNSEWQLDTSFGLDGQSQSLGFNSLGSDTLDDVEPVLSLQCGDRPVVTLRHGGNGANASIGAVRLLSGTIFCDDFED